MNTVSVTELKTRPSKTIKMATDYPVAVESRNKIKAYLIGRELYDKVIAYIEDYLDKAAVRKTDFKKGRDFEKVAQELGI